jgi:hypothetical protein
MVRYILVGAVMVSASILGLANGQSAAATPAVNQVRCAAASESLSQPVGVTDCLITVTCCTNCTK